jgi:hypothetical protein
MFLDFYRTFTYCVALLYRDITARIVLDSYDRMLPVT